LKVERGWQDSYEVNRVLFEPELVTLEQMEGWLKKAGTYIKTLEQPE